LPAVASFEESSLPWWDLLKVECQPDGYLVFQNWRSLNGPLKPGDEVELTEAKVLTYSGCPEYRFVSALRRCGKEASVVE